MIIAVNFFMVILIYLQKIKSAPTEADALKTHSSNCRQTNFQHHYKYAEMSVHFYKNKNTHL